MAERTTIDFNQPLVELDDSDKWFHKLLGVIATGNLWLAQADHALRVEEKPRFETNDHYRSFSAIISEGISNFRQNHPETPITFTKVDGYLTIEKFQELLDEPFTQEQVDQIPYGKDFAAQILGKTLKESIAIVVKLNLQQKLISGGILIQTLQHLVFAKIKRPVARKIQGAATYVDPEVRRMGIPTSDDLNQETYDELIALFEHRTAQDQQPQSLALAITFLLEKYQGNLNQTWNMLAHFCKYVTRDEKRVSQAGEWMQLHILDEYSPKQGYQDLTQRVSAHRGLLSTLVGTFTGLLKFNRDNHNFWADTSLINQVGKVYHSAFLLSMMEAVDVRILALLTAAEYAFYGTGHGPNKAMADALVLQNLLTLEKSATRLQS